MSKIAIIQGLGFGDESKGSTTDYFVRGLKAKNVVRFNGGAQAGHTVELPNGIRHVFSQFGSGTFAGAATYLSKFMLVSPIAMFNEALKLNKLGVSQPMDLISVSPDSKLITPFHVMANQLREHRRGDNKHGSCGMGIGEAVDYSLKFPGTTLTINDLTVKSLAKEKMTAIRDHYREEFPEAIIEASGLLSDDTLDLIVKDYINWLDYINVVPDDDAIISMLVEGNLVFEGAQGVLLDQVHGFQPHTTWSNTTFENALDLLKYSLDDHEISKVGVLRAYSTRHGAGPFITESDELVGIPDDRTNMTNEWQGNFRRGHFDMMLAKYALKVVGQVDELVLSCMDEVKDFIPDYKVCSSYSIKGHITDSLLKWANPILEPVSYKNIVGYLSDNLNVDIRMVSMSPTYEGKIKVNDQKAV